MPAWPFVDAHCHLWDPGVLRYPWLDEPRHRAIAASYGIADYRHELRGWNLAGAVHVEAGAHPDDGERETEWLGGVVAARDWPMALVPRVALDAPDVEARLAWQASHPRVRGVRHVVNWHPRDAARRDHARDLTRDEAWRRGYALLARYGLSFDFHGYPAQLAGLREVAARHPDVPLVIDHLGLPILADGLDEWRAGMAALAALPQVSVKCSGAGFLRAPFDPADVGPIVREVVDLFGTRRVMIASNLPTDRLFATADATLAVYEQLFAAFAEDEQRDLWGRNADAMYRLGLSL